MDKSKEKSIAKRRVLVLQHAESETLGTIQDALTARGVEFDYVRTFNGQAVPQDCGDFSGLIVMGGPMGVYETDRFPFLLQEMKLIEHFLSAEKPILGVCLGSQLVAAVLGAEIKKGFKKEIGWFDIQLSSSAAQDSVWSEIPSRFTAYHWHGDVFDLPKGAVALASSDLTPIQSFRFGDRTYGILFHMEVTHTQIEQMLNEFTAEIDEEQLNPAAIVEQTTLHLPTLQQIGFRVFRQWIKKMN